MDEILNQEKQFLTKYKKLSKSNNLTDISKINELNKEKSLLEFKKDSYEKLNNSFKKFS